jgi:hypothetical protein
VTSIHNVGRSSVVRHNFSSSHKHSPLQKRAIALFPLATQLHHLHLSRRFLAELKYTEFNIKHYYRLQIASR